MRKNISGSMLLLAAAVFVLGKSQPVTSKDIIVRCAQAMGGMEKIRAVKTLRFKAIYPDHGNQPLVFKMKRPNLSMTPSINLVFDGKRACFLKGQDNRSAPELVNAEEWKE